MKNIEAFKKIRWVLGAWMLILAIVWNISLTAHAYTEEEKAQAKAWLSAHGYSPDMGGANQAYQDYLNGKFDEELGIDVNGDGIPATTQATTEGTTESTEEFAAAEADDTVDEDGTEEHTETKASNGNVEKTTEIGDADISTEDDEVTATETQSDSVTGIDEENETVSNEEDIEDFTEAEPVAEESGLFASGTVQIVIVVVVLIAVVVLLVGLLFGKHK